MSKTLSDRAHAVKRRPDISDDLCELAADWVSGSVNSTQVATALGKPTMNHARALLNEAIREAFNRGLLTRTKVIL